MSYVMFCQERVLVRVLRVEMWLLMTKYREITMTKIALISPNFGSRYIIIDQDHKLIFAKVDSLETHLKWTKKYQVILLQLYYMKIMHSIIYKKVQEFAHTVNCLYVRIYTFFTKTSFVDFYLYGSDFSVRYNLP